tara:strand:- start:559 stop:924 length:366 start_codon:yes stop_codon:yes gene_type:complete
MSNETIITGKSADGSDAQVAEGVYDHGNGQWGDTPPPGYRVKRSPVERMIEELAIHLTDTGHTLEQEYRLVQNKKSSLSRRMREFVEFAHEMESLKEKDGTEFIPNNKKEDESTTEDQVTL